MPGLNGTGPRGMGPMTGRGFGKCRGTGQTEGVMSTVEAPEGAVQPGDSSSQFAMKAPLYGAGRGGIPYGCGNGRRFGGGRGCRRE